MFGNMLRWKQLWTQPLHAAWAGVSVLPFALWGSHWWTGALAGLFIALPRELVDQWPLSRDTDAPLDILFFVIGGALVGGLV